MATLNIGMKVNRAISGATTVTANAYAMVTYLAGPDSDTFNAGAPQGEMSTRYFGPGQSIPASFTSQYRCANSAGSVALHTITWSLQSGVELINTI